MKLEVVDKRNPILIRVASVVDTDGHLIKIHFDGWADSYDYWVDDDSMDIHPPGWCAKTGHPLTPPICKFRPQLVSIKLNVHLLGKWLISIHMENHKQCSLL